MLRLPIQGLLGSALSRARSTLVATTSTTSTTNSTTTGATSANAADAAATSAAAAAAGDIPNEMSPEGTPSDQQGDETPMSSSVLDLLDSAVGRAERILLDVRDDDALSQNGNDESSSSSSSSSQTKSNAELASKRPQKKGNAGTTKKVPTLNYRGNPAITNTALAQSLWSSILRPHIDTAIDATCGNGHDSLALARLLFPKNTNADHHGENEEDDEYSRSASLTLGGDSLSRLICIDLQAKACEATKRALMKEFGNSIGTRDSAAGTDLFESGHIQVLQSSHSPLPMDWVRRMRTNQHRKNLNTRITAGDEKEEEEDMIEAEDLSVALVVYNLGWLPRKSGEENKQNDMDQYVITQMDTTLQSMVDAMLLLRIGGMLSVVTYPKTNSQEDLAVRTFLECAALLSSNVETWQGFLEELSEQQPPHEHQGGSDTGTETSSSNSIVASVKESMERLVGNGDACQTWRVSEHRKLGMDRAPILLTATRIK